MRRGPASKTGPKQLKSRGGGLTSGPGYWIPSPPRGRIIDMKNIKKGDLVQVMTGTDRGKQGRVIAVDHHKGRVRVESVRMRKRHLKPGRAGAQQGGVVEDEGFIDASNVLLVHPEDNQPSRVRVEHRDGQRTRVFVRGGQDVPEPAVG